MSSRKNALRFVVLVGIVSLFADVTYEGARSLNGQYLALLGASGAVVGFVAGFGELIGYCLRLVSGVISDKTKRYWLLTMTGYGINLIAVPCLALAGSWQAAALLMITERFGKALRTPARDVMLSQASFEIGRGWAFALHEALDQIGAVTGPLVVMAVMWVRGDYRACYTALWLPALAALAVLALARWIYPRPGDWDRSPKAIETKKFSKSYLLCVVAAALVAAGYADFPLIAYHFEKVNSVPKIWIPALYSLAMASDAAAALFFGKWFDRRGLWVLAVSSLMGAFFAPLVFSTSLMSAGCGMILWGVGMGAQESIFKAAISQTTGQDKRGTAFGYFHAGYGLSWFAGSALMGFLYDRSVHSVIIFSVLIQLGAIPLFVAASKEGKH